MSTEVTRTNENFKSIIESLGTNLNKLDKLEMSIRDSLSIIKNDSIILQGKEEKNYTNDIIGEFQRLDDAFKFILERLEKCNNTLNTLV